MTSQVLFRTVATGVRRITLAIAYLTVMFLSWMPATLKPDAGITTGDEQHFVVYFILGVLTAAFHGEKYKPIYIAIGISAFAGVMELGQFFVPNRTVGFDNFAMSSLGAILGIVLVATVSKRP